MRVICRTLNLDSSASGSNLCGVALCQLTWQLWQGKTQLAKVKKKCINHGFLLTRVTFWRFTVQHIKESYLFLPSLIPKIRKLWQIQMTLIVMRSYGDVGQRWTFREEAKHQKFACTCDMWSVCVTEKSYMWFKPCLNEVTFKSAAGVSHICSTTYTRHWPTFSLSLSARTPSPHPTPTPHPPTRPHSAPLSWGALLTCGACFAKTFREQLRYCLRARYVGVNTGQGGQREREATGGVIGHQCGVLLA